ncbi:MAG: EAL domain-containing protein [Actinomycetota bacterium]|nr:EAL domain-containing protein [Actinomycetota bacterium]
MRAAPSPLALTDERGVFLGVNQPFCSFVGCDEDEVVGRAVEALLAPEDVADEHALMRRLLDGDVDAGRLDQRYRRCDGAVVPVRCDVWRARGRPDGEQRRLHVLRILHPLGAEDVDARDITQRKRAEPLLAGQARVLEMIAGTSDLHQILDALAELIEAHATTARCSILLLDHGGPGHISHGGGLQLPGIENLVEEVPPDALGGPHAAAAQIVADLATDPRCNACRHMALDLELRSCWSSPIVAPGSDSVLGVFALYYRAAYSPDEEDWELLARLTHVAALAIGRHRTMEQLAHQAIHDPLTGAANRTLVCDRLGNALNRLKRQRSSVAVLFLDLDRFKALNDSYGHEAGDSVLIELTKRLQSAVRPSDTVARMGGDEFVVLCEGVLGELEVVGIAERISQAVEVPFLVDHNEVSLTASIGIALPRGDETPQSLLEQADAAMYQAKERGKARYQLFDTAMHQRALRRLQTEEALRRALHQGELKLVYQPLVKLVGEEIVGVEALLRWDHPEQGLLGPADFLSVAEDSGLIVPIGAWVIEEACRQAAHWGNGDNTEGMLKVHVNVSGRQLRLRELPQVVRDAVTQSGVDPSAISLEITETVLMDDAPTALRVLGALKSLGVRLSIDDFGTGYSSLTYVDSFPVDELKIDRSFIADVREDEERPIVLAVISLAHALDLEVVAEGVETAEQADQLRRMGCDTAQGYYWSRPLSPDDVSRLRDRDGPFNRSPVGSAGPG